MKRFRPPAIIAVIPALLALLAGSAVVATPASAASIAAVPTAPELRSQGTGRDFFSIQWEDRSTNESGFRVQTRGPGGAWQTAREVPNTGAGQPGATGQRYGALFDGLFPPIEVCYRVGAWNAEGTSYSASRCTVPTVAGSDFEVASKTLTSVTLRWVDNSWRERHFNLYQGFASEGAEGLSIIASVPGFPDSRGTVHTYTVTGLSSSIVYMFGLKGVNNVGEDTRYVTVTVRPG